MRELRLTFLTMLKTQGFPAPRLLVPVQTTRPKSPGVLGVKVRTDLVECWVNWLVATTALPPSSSSPSSISQLKVTFSGLAVTSHSRSTDSWTAMLRMESWSSLQVGR